MPSTTSLPRASSRSATTPWAPSSANRCTVARPMPEQPPVTTATFPSRRPVMFSSLPRSTAVGEVDVLLLGERVGRVGSELTSEAGLLVATERRPIAHRGVRVHRQVAGLDAACHPERAAEV